MSKRVLMINLHSYQNAGDAALNISAAQQLRRNFPGCELTLALNDPASYPGEARVVGSFVNWLQRPDALRRPRWNWLAFAWLPWSALLLAISRWAGCGVVKLAPRSRRQLLQAYCQADLVVSSPGGYLYSSGQLGLSLFIALYAMVAALLAGKPLYLLPQSIGPLRRRHERWLVGWVLARARLVMVREAISLAELPLPLAERQHVFQLPDMAVNLQAESVDKADDWLAQLGMDGKLQRPLLGMTVINWEDQNRNFHTQSVYEQAFSQAARYFIQQQHGSVIFFPQVCGPTSDQDDRVPARRVAAQLSDLAERVFVVEQPPQSAMLKSIYGRMDVFIGTRMHSNIFAATQGVPTLAIGYQFKTRGIARTLGIEDWVFEISTINAEALVERLAELWANRQQVRANLLLRLPELERETDRAGALVAEDFKRWLESRSSK